MTLECIDLKFMRNVRGESTKKYEVIQKKKINQDIAILRESKKRKKYEDIYQFEVV